MGGAIHRHHGRRCGRSHVREHVARGRYVDAIRSTFRKRLGACHRGVAFAEFLHRGRRIADRRRKGAARHRPRFETRVSISTGIRAGYDRHGTHVLCAVESACLAGACLNIPREPRWQGRISMRCGRAWPTASDPCGGADARTPQRTDPMAQAIVKGCVRAKVLANPSGPGRFPLMRRCRLLIGSLPNLVGSALPEGKSATVAATRNTQTGSYRTLTDLSPRPAPSRRCCLASSDRSPCRRLRYSGVTSPVTYSPEKHEVSKSVIFALSWRTACSRSSRS